ncbi:MAG TPA: nucleoside triphosphate pyrophosphohydrolase [Candidatus Polarisedimenticolaceae bacterium]|nr:nucleoside triphosphate pyrophosphohydrolase [Candidatus Polarisedimenticolaceae bacterium]
MEAKPASFADLVALMDRLRGPDGCPWDREQTYATLRGYALEECYEVVEALDRGDPAALCEELGDLLFQIVFLARLAQEQDRFTIHDVIDSITTKMVRRHPHVFGAAVAETSEDVLRNWERIKREEKTATPAASSVLDGIPTALPALLKAQRLGTKAARIGFDWPGPAAVLQKVDEELSELREAVRRDDARAARDELGDLLFALAMLARHLRLDPDAALERTNRKFRRRFAWIEAELARDGRSAEQAGSEQLERLWSVAKRELGGEPD